jgi:DNA (cytosine-5)-methyltransferase 1
MKHLDCFSGIGGFSLAAKRVWGSEYDNVGFVEIDRYCQEILKMRFKEAMIYGDIRKVTAADFNADIDILTGGFPCQPFSTCGKRKGKEDNRYLWPELHRLIRETRPRWFIGENVAGIIKMELDTVLSDLEKEGYSTQTFIIPACGINAPHRRNRVWIVGYSQKSGTTPKREVLGEGEGNKKSPDTFEIVPNVADSDGNVLEKRGVARYHNTERFIKRSNVDASDTQSGESRQQAKQEGGEDTCGGSGEVTTYPNVGGIRRHERQNIEKGTTSCGSWSENWIEVATRLCGVDDGLPARVDGLELSKQRHRIKRLEALGNAIVPEVVEEIMIAIKLTEGRNG